MHRWWVCSFNSSTLMGSPHKRAPTLTVLVVHVFQNCGFITVWLVLTVTCVSIQNSGQWIGSADLSHAVECRPSREEHPAVRREARSGRNSRLQSPIVMITSSSLTSLLYWLLHYWAHFYSCQDKHIPPTTEHKSSFRVKGHLTADWK